MIGLLLGLLLGATPVPAFVVRVLDGDTVDTTYGRVRLRCIDAPELGQRPYGQDSKQQLSSFLPVGSPIQLLNRGNGGFGRVSSEIFVNGQNINLAMVGLGQAFVYNKYLSGCHKNNYLQAESNAQMLGIGIWNVQNGIQRPWDFRN